MDEHVISVNNLSKSYKTKSCNVAALTDISFSIERGEIKGIIGFSGAGKSTLVRCLNGLEKPDSGNVVVCGYDISHLKEKELLPIRRKIGMIFQNFNLFQQRTVLKNVMFPLEIAKVKKAEAEERAKQLLEEMNLLDKLSAYPTQLSGGQQQRVAIARALAANPEILICDEATSALDPETTVQILTRLKEINKKYGITLIVISHQLGVIKSICDSVAVLDGGILCEEGNVESVFSSPQSNAAKRLIAYGGVI